LIKASIVGISGYGGIELFRILSGHPEVKIVSIYSESNKGQKIGTLYPQFSHADYICDDKTPDEIAEMSDVIFAAVPHGGASIPYVKSAKKYGKKIIDLSAEFRLKDKNIYEEWYEGKHEAVDLLKEAVYGLPELHKEEIKKAWLIGNPGCYTTAGILSNSPLLKEKIIDTKSIIIDSKSGTSGAGKKPKQNLHFSELDEGFCAYSVPRHRHTPEIEQELSFMADESIIITFTPHLVPMIRGILSVSYSTPVKKITEKDLYDIYKDFYSKAPFVRIVENLPNTKYVTGSNFIDICLKIDERTGRIIVVSALDNLIKGASGQAVHNMNLMFGLKETSGLEFVGVYP
jgi:N-acetyl-gamma-glutamyl-phosphate reductase